ncbi:hypothetical protein ACFORG_14880 [Lutimaribacter marinistellae]|uniref:Uncharacterized protein n=1 Tax=Lutimaribacter marinistellae TaxID=1820329 RepID=A0ABV7TIC7_9RHOB
MNEMKQRIVALAISAFASTSSVASAEEGEQVYLDKNWSVSKEQDVGPICLFKNRKTDLELALGVAGDMNVFDEPPVSLLWIFTEVPKNESSTSFSMGGSDLPPPSRPTDLYTEGDVANLELEFLTDIEDDLTAGLVAKSIIGRFRNHDEFFVGEHRLYLGDGAGAFSEENLRSCFSGAVTKSEAERLGLPSDVVAKKEFSPEVCKLAPSSNEEIIEAEIQYHRTSDDLKAVLITHEKEENGGRWIDITNLECTEKGDIRTCVGGTIFGLNEEEKSYWKTTVWHSGNMLKAEHRKMDDGRFVTATSKDTYTYLFRVDGCTE